MKPIQQVSSASAAFSQSEIAPTLSSTQSAADPNCNSAACAPVAVQAEQSSAESSASEEAGPRARKKSNAGGNGKADGGDGASMHSPSQNAARKTRTLTSVSRQSSKADWSSAPAVDSAASGASGLLAKMFSKAAESAAQKPRAKSKPASGGADGRQAGRRGANDAVTKRGSDGCGGAQPLKAEKKRGKRVLADWEGESSEEVIGSSDGSGDDDDDASGSDDDDDGDSDDDDGDGVPPAPSQRGPTRSGRQVKPVATAAATPRAAARKSAATRNEEQEEAEEGVGG
eukprot:6056830-Pleurochrysis_carterae.AAC.1